MTYLLGQYTSNVLQMLNLSAAWVLYIGFAISIIGAVVLLGRTAIYETAKSYSIHIRPAGVEYTGLLFLLLGLLIAAPGADALSQSIGAGGPGLSAGTYCLMSSTNTNNCSSSLCSYYIYISGTNYMGKNCSTGANDYQNTNAVKLTQAVVSKVIALGGGVIDIGTGSYRFSSFSDTIYHAALDIDTKIASGSSTPYIHVKIQGSGGGFTTTEGGTNVAIVSGGTIIDASALDVLQFGIFTIGRVFFVPPPPTISRPPVQGLALEIDDLSIIVPAYTSLYGTGPCYSGSGMGSSCLFIAGDTATANVPFTYEFVNGIDAFSASALQISHVSIVNAVAGLNNAAKVTTGLYGAAAGIVWPNADNQNQLEGDTIQTWGVLISLYGSVHMNLNVMYTQDSEIGIYDWQGGHSVDIHRWGIQAATVALQHGVLPQLSNSVSGGVDGAHDPITDLYTPLGISAPSSANSATQYVIDTMAIENIGTRILTDDSSHPMSVFATVDYTGSEANSIWGSGAKLHIMWINPAADPFLGWATTTPSVPANGVAQTNTNPFPVNVYLTGINTLTAIGITDTEHPTVTNTFTATFIPGNWFQLQVNESIILTYGGAAPTWAWYGLNTF